jgi:hypothetical protein
MTRCLGVPDTQCSRWVSPERHPWGGHVFVRLPPMSHSVVGNFGLENTEFGMGVRHLVYIPMPD